MSCHKYAFCHPNDFIYDPLFIVSSKKDYYRAGYKARLSNATYAVCPVFGNMFSDMPQYPRIAYLMRKQTPIPPYVEHKAQKALRNATKREEENEVNGAKRFKYFQAPAIKPAEPEEENLIVTTRKTDDPLADKQKFKTTCTQTKYRESSAQTHPWQPDFKVIEGDPEVLKLDFLKWGAGLPAGAHEIRLIERARMKRNWEARLPNCTSQTNIEKRRKIIEAIESNEWAFREHEIQGIQDLRMELLEQMLGELHEKSACRVEQKMKLICDRVEKTKKEKLAKLHAKTNRELRKLKMRNDGFSGKYKAVNIVEEFADPTSELYAPLMRHGSHPKRWHLKMDFRNAKYNTSFAGVENVNTVPSWLEQATYMKDCMCIKLPGTRLCMRETKWTTPVLKHLYDELKKLRTVEKPICGLKIRIPKPITPPVTPEVGCDESDETEGIIAVTRIQSILRGRASQTLIYSGRDRCKKLIDELKTTHALLEHDKARQFVERCEVKNQQREQELCLKNAAKLHEILNRLQGTIVGTLLDFLNKELHKLMEERKTHAMCLMAERERHRREAAEAGRRQKEIRRRKEHDEIFKQVIKIRQETVDMYLQDIITEGLQFASEQQAREYVVMKAAEFEEETKKPIKGIQEQEEYIANLVHHFVLPEVEKRLHRERTLKYNKALLQSTHDMIYNKMETLPKVTEKGSEHSSIISQLIIDDENVVEVATEEQSEVESAHSLDDFNFNLSELLAQKSSLSILKQPMESGISLHELMKDTYVEEPDEPPPIEIIPASSAGEIDDHGSTRPSEDKKDRIKDPRPSKDRRRSRSSKDRRRSSKGHSTPRHSTARASGERASHSTPHEQKQRSSRSSKDKRTSKDVKAHSTPRSPRESKQLRVSRETSPILKLKPKEHYVEDIIIADFAVSQAKPKPKVVAEEEKHPAHKSIGFGSVDEIPTKVPTVYERSSQSMERKKKMGATRFLVSKQQEDK